VAPRSSRRRTELDYEVTEVGRWAHSSGCVAGPPLSITSMADGGRLNVATGYVTQIVSPLEA
jgi:hypothetical protein